MRITTSLIAALLLSANAMGDCKTKSCLLADEIIDTRQAALMALENGEHERAMRLLDRAIEAAKEHQSLVGYDTFAQELIAIREAETKD